MAQYVNNTFKEVYNLFTQLRNFMDDSELLEQVFNIINTDTMADCLESICKDEDYCVLEDGEVITELGYGDNEMLEEDF